MANTSIGRFWRLYLRNVAGFLPQKNDKATFGNTWRVVVAENEDVVKEIGWKPLSVDMGYEAGDNTITVSRFTGGNHVSSISGSTPEEMLPYLADGVVRQYSWQIMFTVGQGMGTLRPLILLGPIIARTIASWGWSKEELKQYLFDHARIPAREYERILRDWTAKPIWNLEEEFRLGRIPRVFFESDDPDRMVPLVWEPDDYMTTRGSPPPSSPALPTLPAISIDCAKVCARSAPVRLSESTTSMVPEMPTTVTTLASRAKPRSTCSGVQGLSASFSAKQNVYFAGWPSVAISISPGRAPPTF